MISTSTRNPRPEARGDVRWLTSGLVTLGIGLAVHALVGPLAADAVDYPIAETFRNQAIGLDAVSMFVAAPLAILAGVLVTRRRTLGSVLATIVGAYTSYVMTQFILGPGAPHYPGTVWLQLALFVLGWMLAARAWSIAATSPTSPIGSDVRRHSLALFTIAGFVVLRYLPTIGAAAGGDTIPQEALSDPTMFWSIWLMDVGVFVPLLIIGGVALRRGARWAPWMLIVLVGWFALVAIAIAVMAIVMLVRDDPYASGALVALLAVVAALVIPYSFVLLHGVDRGVDRDDDGAAVR